MGAGHRPRRLPSKRSQVLTRVPLRVSAATAVVLALLAAVPAGAADDRPYDAEYANGTGRKLERGVSNAALGWMDIPREISRQGKEHGVLHAVFVGPFVGAGKAVVRTAAGVYEAATFPIPTPPPHTSPGQPEFVLDKGPSTS